MVNDAESRNSSVHDLQSLGERERDRDRERRLREVREKLEAEDIFRPPLSPFVVAQAPEERLLYCHHSMYDVRPASQSAGHAARVGGVSWRTPWQRQVDESQRETAGRASRERPRPKLRDPSLTPLQPSPHSQTPPAGHGHQAPH